jgi:hypothetical protein
MTTTAEPPPVAGPMILTAGLDCHQPAEIQWRAVLDSTDRPAEHVKILCVQRHWFVLPVASIAGVDANGHPRTPPCGRTRRNQTL